MVDATLSFEIDYFLGRINPTKLLRCQTIDPTYLLCRFAASYCNRHNNMSRNLRMMEEQMDRGQSPGSVFGLAKSDRAKPTNKDLPKKYQPENTTPIRPAKPEETPSVDFKIEALQEGGAGK